MNTELLLENTQKASILLQKIKKMSFNQLTSENIFLILQEIFQLKLMIPKTSDTNIQHLIIQNIKSEDVQLTNLSDEIIQQKLKKYDCHRTSLIAHKKTLLFLSIEKELGISLTDDEAVSIQTLEQFSLIVAHHLREDKLYGH